MPFDQQEEQLHGEFFQSQKAVTPMQPITRLIEREIPELELVGHEFPLTWVAEIILHNPHRSNRISNLGVQPNFISPS